MRDANFPYLPKDFIQTKEGLIFAVVSYQPQAEKVGCFLRYIPNNRGFEKMGTAQANLLLKQVYPQYFYQSSQFDATFHAVKTDEIITHFKPEQRLKTVLAQKTHDEIEQKLQGLIPILVRFGVECDALGLTGSMLINQQGATSDIDLVVYGRKQFQKTRQAIEQAVAAGELEPLDEQLMWDNFQRRAGVLSLNEFTWHENRKFNKAVIEGCKFDIGMMCLSDEIEHDKAQYQKQGGRIFKTKVIDDHRAFDFPAVYHVEDKLTPKVLSFTHTYVGQAKKGEIIEVSGAVERNVTTGKCRLIVGSTREADGEYIKVCK